MIRYALPWLPLLAAACAPAEPAPSHTPADLISEQAPPPLAHQMTLALDAPVVRTHRLKISGTGANPGDRIHLLYGNQIGPGPCPSFLGGGCTEVTAARKLVHATANGNGGVQWDLSIPASVPAGATVPFQLIVASGAGSYASAAILVEILPHIDLLAQLSGPTQAEAGDDLSSTLVTVLSNDGLDAQDAASGATESLYLSSSPTLDGSEVLLATRSLPSVAGQDFEILSAWSAGSAVIDPTTPPGSYWIVSQIDSGEVVAELDETNNLASAALTVLSPMPDLVITNFQIVEPFVGTGDRIEFTWDVTNVGDATTTAPYIFASTTLYDGPTNTPYGDEGEGRSVTLAPGESVSFDRYVNVLPSAFGVGLHEVEIVLDEDDLVTESDEANNVQRFLFEVVDDLPNLVVRNVRTESVNVWGENATTLLFDVVNEGLGPTSVGNVSVSSEIVHGITGVSRHALIQSEPNLTLQVGESQSFTHPIAALDPMFTNDIHLIRVTADPTTWEQELDETDNVAIQPVLVRDPAVNVWATSVNVTGPIYPGRVVDDAISVGVINDASFEVSGMVVSFYWSDDETLDGSDVLLGSSSVPSIPVLGVETVRSPLGTTLPASALPNTTGSLLAWVDAFDVLTEFDELDNVGDRQVQVSAAPSSVASGTLSMDVTQAADVDVGIVPATAPGDVFWQTGASRFERKMTPTANADIVLLDAGDGLDDCLTATSFDAEIVNPPVGRHLCVHTNGGHYALLEIVSVSSLTPYTLTFDFETFTW